MIAHRKGLARALGILALGALGGCQLAQVQAPAPKPEVIEVKLAVSKPCIPQVPGSVNYRWGVGPLPPTDKEKVAILLADYEQARQRDTEWEAAAAGCVVKP